MNTSMKRAVAAALMCAMMATSMTVNVSAAGDRPINIA